MHNTQTYTHVDTYKPQQCQLWIVCNFLVNNTAVSHYQYYYCCVEVAKVRCGGAAGYDRG